MSGYNSQVLNLHKKLGKPIPDMPDVDLTKLNAAMNAKSTSQAKTGAGQSRFRNSFRFNYLFINIINSFASWSVSFFFSVCLGFFIYIKEYRVDMRKYPMCIAILK